MLGWCASLKLRRAADQLVLENAHNNFERGRLDTFVLKAAPVGAVSKAKLSFTPRRLFPDWHLDTVWVQAGATAQTSFPYKQWISKSGVYDLVCDGLSQTSTADDSLIEYRVHLQARN